jgi:hypothetical protein
MKSRLTFAIRAILILIANSYFAGLASAQFSKLDDLASQIAKELKPLKPHLVAVADLRSVDGTSSAQGHYFAWLLSDAWQARARKKIAVAGHKAFDTDLQNLKIPRSSLAPGDAPQAVSPQIGADILVTGTIEKKGRFIPARTHAGSAGGRKKLLTSQSTVDASEFLDSIVTPFPDTICSAAKDNRKR